MDAVPITATFTDYKPTFNKNPELNLHFSDHEQENEKGVSFMCRAFEEVRDEGRKEGILEGIKEGIKEGRLAGINENSVETAKNLIKMGILSLEQISQATSLSIDKVRELAEA